MRPLADARAAAAIARRRFRAGSASTAVFVGLVGVTAFLAVAMPRVYASALDEAARRAIAEAPAIARDLQFTRTDSLAPGADAADPLATVRAEGDELDASMPASIQRLVSDRYGIVDTVEFVVEDAPVAVTQLKLRIQEGLDGKITWAEGRPPETDSRMALPGRVDELGQPYMADVYEIALSTATMDAVRLEVGDELIMSPDENDLLVERYGANGPRYVVARIVGRFDVVDDEDPYWFDDPGLRAAVREPISPELAFNHITALVPATAYGRMVGVGADPLTSVDTPLRYAWRRAIDPGRIDAADLATLATDVTRLTARYPFTGTNTTEAPASLRWGLLGVLERHAVQQRASSVTLALAALGPIGTAAGALALVALLVVRRRSAGTRVLRSRGATPAQLLLAAAFEGVALVLPAVLGGALIAWALTAEAAIEDAPARAAIVGLVGVALLVIGTIPLTRGTISAGDAGSDRPPTRARGRVRGRRLVLEVTIVAVAVMATLSLRSRGAGAGQGGIAIDPLLAAVPVLIALATGLVLLRIYPVPLRALAAVAARGRGLIPTFPLWGAARHSRMAAIPLLVILVATAMGAFSAAILETLSDGQAAAAWRSVGADWRVDGDRQFGVPSGFHPETIDGIDASTGVVAKEARIRTDVVRRTQVRVDGIDPNGLAAVTSASPLPIGLPPTFERADWAGVGTEDDPLPVVVSPDMAARGQVGIGARFDLAIAGIGAAAEVVGIREPLPGSPTDEPSVIAPLGALVAAYPGVTWAPTTYLLRGDLDAADGLRAAAAPYGDLIDIRSREAIFAILHDAPLVETLQAGIAVAIGVAVAYAALALLAGLTLILADRRRDLHVLRTLGLSRRDLTSSILIEHVPLVLVALVGGTLAGLGIAWLIGPSIGLEAYADGGPTPPLAIDPVATLVVGVLPTVLGIVAVSIAAILVRRADLGRAMRFQES